MTTRPGTCRGGLQRRPQNGTQLDGREEAQKAQPRWLSGLRLFAAIHLGPSVIYATEFSVCLMVSAKSDAATCYCLVFFRQIRDDSGRRETPQTLDNQELMESGLGRWTPQKPLCRAGPPGKRPHGPPPRGFNRGRKREKNVMRQSRKVGTARRPYPSPARRY
jgi:hypothetical protein